MREARREVAPWVTSPKVTRRRAPGDRDANAEGDRESDERAGLGVRDGSPRRFAGRSVESARGGLALRAHFACSRVRFLSSARGSPGSKPGFVPSVESRPATPARRRSKRRAGPPPRGGRARPRARRARRHRPPRQTERRVEVVGLEATPRFCLRGPAPPDVVDGIDDIGIVFLLFGYVSVTDRARNAFDRARASALTRALASRSPRVPAARGSRLLRRGRASRASPLRHATSRSGRPWRRPSSPPPRAPISRDRRPRRVVGRDVFGGARGAARHVHRARRDSVRRHRARLDRVQRLERAQRDGNAFRSERRVRSVDHAVQVFVLRTRRLALSSRFREARRRPRRGRQPAARLRLRRREVRAQTLERAPRALPRWPRALLQRR